MKRILVGLLVLVIAALLVVGGLRLHKARLQEVNELPPPELAPWALHVGRVERTTVESGFPVLATISAQREITVSGQVSGTLLEMGPREGVAVRAGDLLARVDTREIEESRASLAAQLKGARADAVRTTRDFRRARDLYADKTISASEMDAARAANTNALEKVRSLERQIKSLDVRIGYGRVLAPANGVVSARLAEPGDVCQISHPIYRLTVDNATRVQVRLPQSVLEGVHPGTSLVLMHGARVLRVSLDRVYPALDAQALGAAEADLAQRPFGLPSGARVSARVILRSQADILRVPLRALLRGDAPGRGRVFKVAGEGAKARLREVPVAVELEGHAGVAVSGGLEVGDRVVVAHRSVLLRLRDGDPVTVARGDAP